MTAGGILVADALAAASAGARRTSLLAPQDYLDELPANVVTEKMAQGQSRLEMLQEVNRRLHRTLVDKKINCEKLREANTKMASRVQYRSVEGPAREARIKELVDKLQGEQSHQQTGTLQMSKKILTLEEKIAELTTSNSQLHEQHRHDRSVLSEQQVAIKQKTKKVKELTRQIEFLEGHVDMSCKMETMSMSDTASVVDSQLGGRSSYQGADGNTTLGAMKAASQVPLTIEDYRKLPGMNLSLLLGNSKKDRKG
jgi:chromosome segregation ATPase